MSQGSCLRARAAASLSFGQATTIDHAPVAREATTTAYIHLGELICNVCTATLLTTINTIRRRERWVRHRSRPIPRPQTRTFRCYRTPRERTLPHLMHLRILPRSRKHTLLEVFVVLSLISSMSSSVSSLLLQPLIIMPLFYSLRGCTSGQR